MKKTWISLVLDSRDVECVLISPQDIVSISAKADGKSMVSLTNGLIFHVTDDSKLIRKLIDDELSKLVAEPAALKSLGVQNGDWRDSNTATP